MRLGSHIPSLSLYSVGPCRLRLCNLQCRDINLPLNGRSITEFESLFKNGHTRKMVLLLIKVKDIYISLGDGICFINIYL